VCVCPPKAKVTRSNRVRRTICQGFANYAAGSPLHRFQLSGHAAFGFHSFSLERRALRTGPSRLSGKRPNRRVGVAALRPARRVVRNGGIYVLGARARPMTLSLGLGDRWPFLSSQRRRPSDSARVCPRRKGRRCAVARPNSLGEFKLRLGVSHDGDGRGRRRERGPSQK